MARPRKTRQAGQAGDQSAGKTVVRLEVARSSSLRLSVRPTTKKDRLLTVSYALSSDEYRRLVLWQYLHRDDVPSVPTAVRHLLNRQLPDDLVILRRKLVAVEGDGASDTPGGDDVELLPVGTLRAVPPAIADGERVIQLRVGLLEDEHLRLTLWGLEHASCLGTTELGPAIRHLVMLSLADEDLVVGRRRPAIVLPPVAPPAYSDEQLIMTRQALGLSATQPQAAAA